MQFNILQRKLNEFETDLTLESIQSREIDGLIVKGFLSPDEIAVAKKNIASSSCSISTETPYGKIIGKKMQSENGNFQELPFNEYLKNSEEFREMMPSVVGFDFENKFRQVCKNHTNTSASVPSINGRSYVPATISNLTPGGGGIIAHVGNGFIDKMDEIIALQDIANPYNQLSFFCVVQTPEQGGELVLFDATWEETDSRGLSFEESSEYIKDKERQVITLEEGDLLIFAAGEIWHEVTPISGKKNRMTIGGFIAPSISKKQWYFWS